MGNVGCLVTTGDENAWQRDSSGARNRSVQIGRSCRSHTDHIPSRRTQPSLIHPAPRGHLGEQEARPEVDVNDMRACPRARLNRIPVHPGARDDPHQERDRARRGAADRDGAGVFGCTE